MPVTIGIAGNSMPFNQPVPRPFMPIAVQTYAPVAPGLYGISNAREWIYIGECEDIRSALLAYLENPHTDVMRRQPTGFVFEICDGVHRAARQDRLVLEYEPTYNRRVHGRI